LVDALRGLWHGGVVSLWYPLVRVCLGDGDGTPSLGRHDVDGIVLLGSTAAHELVGIT